MRAFGRLRPRQPHDRLDRDGAGVCHWRGWRVHGADRALRRCDVHDDLRVPLAAAVAAGAAVQPAAAAVVAAGAAAVAAAVAAAAVSPPLGPCGYRVESIPEGMAALNTNIDAGTTFTINSEVATTGQGSGGHFIVVDPETQEVLGSWSFSESDPNYGAAGWSTSSRVSRGSSRQDRHRFRQQGGGDRPRHRLFRHCASTSVRRSSAPARSRRSSSRSLRARSSSAATTRMTRRSSARSCSARRTARRRGTTSKPAEQRGHLRLRLRNALLPGEGEQQQQREHVHRLRLPAALLADGEVEVFGPHGAHWAVQLRVLRRRPRDGCGYSIIARTRDARASDPATASRRPPSRSRAAPHARFAGEGWYKDGADAKARAMEECAAQLECGCVYADGTGKYHLRMCTATDGCPWAAARSQSRRSATRGVCSPRRRRYPVRRERQRPVRAARPAAADAGARRALPR